MIRFEKFNEGLQVLSENENFVAPPPGLYVCRIMKVFHDASVPEKEYVGISFQVAAGDHAGKRFSNRWYLRDDRGIGAGKFLGLIKACGIEPTEKFDEQELVGKMLEVKLRERQHNNKTYNDVHWVQPVSDESVPF